MNALDASSKLFLMIASVTGFLAVAFGAFGAHALKARLSPEMLTIFETGARYQIYHALALLGVGLLIQLLPSSRFLPWAGYSMSLGILIFSGSLYALSLSGVKVWGAVTPLGGVCLLAGWLLILIGLVKS